tara:strand:+ start:287 stop:1027 length:741 start_codon:yes stop_codon:yes gene_type:complete
MDLIMTLTLIAFGSLLFPPKDKNGSSNQEGEAQPIPLEYIDTLTTSVLDPEVVNVFRNQTVGTNSYLTVTQTSSYEFLNIQPDNIVPPRFKNTQPSGYFFTVPNNKKVFFWDVPEVYYALRVIPSKSGGLDTVQELGRSENLNTVVNIIQDNMKTIVDDYNLKVNDRDVIGDNEQENPQDDVGQGQSGFGGGFGAFSANMNEEDEEVVIEENVPSKPTKNFVVVDKGNVIGSEVNLGGSPYAGLGF